jgi:hypothetical protein
MAQPSILKHTQLCEAAGSVPDVPGIQACTCLPPSLVSARLLPSLDLDHWEGEIPNQIQLWHPRTWTRNGLFTVPRAQDEGSAFPLVPSDLTRAGNAG